MCILAAVSWMVKLPAVNGWEAPCTPDAYAEKVSSSSPVVPLHDRATSPETRLSGARAERITSLLPASPRA